jgi:hypothetical protein
MEFQRRIILLIDRFGFGVPSLDEQSGMQCAARRGSE